MERRFEIQKRKILKEADIKPQVFNGMLKRLEQFVKPFIASLGRRGPKENAHIYISRLDNTFCKAQKQAERVGSFSSL